MFELVRFGPRICALTIGLGPSPAGVVTTTVPSPALVPVTTCSWLPFEAGSVHETRSDQKRLAPGACSQSFVHWPAASLVQATDRPNPYCQAASTGSSFLLTRTISPVGLGVVAT